MFLHCYFFKLRQGYDQRFPVQPLIIRRNPQPTEELSAKSAWRTTQVGLDCDNSQPMTPIPTPPPPPSRAESLIEYPSAFPIKVMGNNADGLVHAVSQIATSFDPQFDASTIELRPSKAGNYLGITLTVTATSREQLDALYRALSTHPLVKVVL